jgi:ribonuclease P protein component
MANNPRNDPQNKWKILRKRQEFLAVAAGRRLHFSLFTLQFQSQKHEIEQNLGHVEGTEKVKEIVPDPNIPRIGLTVTKKIGNSVVRNRIRRRLRAALDQIPICSIPAQDYVIIARQSCLSTPFHNLVDVLNQALQKSCRPLKPSPIAARAVPTVSV